MNEDKALEKTRIPFPRAIDLDEAHKLLRHLATNLHASIHYSAGYKGNVCVPEGCSDSIDDRGSISLDLMVSRISPFAVDSLSFVLGSDDFRKFAGLQFQATPGFDTCDYTQGNITLWDDTKKHVQEYFQ
ncbi:MAG: hypothetical protein ABIH37_05725 [archaeon]